MLTDKVIDQVSADSGTAGRLASPSAASIGTLGLVSLLAGDLSLKKRELLLFGKGLELCLLGLFGRC